MAHAVEQWGDALLQQMPRGRAWPRDPDANLPKYVMGFAKRLAELELSADQLLLEMRPETTVVLLPEWEECLGLPECGIVNQPFEMRRAAVVEKYHRKGGLQTWMIEQIAAALGFTVKVSEQWPHHVLRSVTYPIYPASTRFVLRVDVYDLPEERFTVLDNVLIPLRGNAPLVLECVLNRLKLAGFYYDFNYEV
ncbi:YmfQ family protein [Aeromonas hydrophila]|uniref:YmfQ family protein n=1 Tax=Aeromonas hydrophila TaxID=644 RepID=UPI002B05C82A|nr:putative phage tail protein [Aeromonas hydrophila]